MQFLIVPAIQCVTQACCWYTVFKCCGCIDNGHVEIEKQTQTQTQPASNPSMRSPNPFQPTGAPKLSNSPNPFLNPNANVDAYLGSVYKKQSV